jgi:anaerobic magnesium-protoporphyrin IX monomethyl ester cyclase
MKIALINFEEEGGYLPLATAYIAGYLREKGFENIKIIDRVNILNEIKNYKPDLIGVGLYSATYFQANKLAEKIKKISNAPLIAGGPHVYCNPAHIKESNFDVGVVGEGEETFHELANLYQEKSKFSDKDLKKIQGLVFTDKKNKLNFTPSRELIKDLDKIPPPAIDLLKLKEHYLIPGPAGAHIVGIRGYIVTSRGCPYNCIYCSSKTIWPQVRWHSAERTVAEIKTWVKKYGATHIYIYDDLMIANRPRLRKIISLLRKEGLLGKVDFEILGRANLIDEEMCKLLQEMNASSVAIGFETGSERLLKYLKGGTVTIEQGEKAIKLLKKYKIKITGLFMVGSPTETEEDLKKTFKMASNPDIELAHVSFSVPFPDTQFWEYAINNKIFPKDFYEAGTYLTQDSVNFDYLLTKEISLEKFKQYWFKFMGLVKEKEKKYSPKFTLGQLKLLFSWRLFKKILKRKRHLHRHIGFALNRLLKI